MPLEEEEQRHVEAAQGFFELGMFLDADAELDRVDPYCRQLPEVLEVRAKIYAALRKCELAEVVTKRLWDVTDEAQWAEAWALALRNKGAIKSARAVLGALERHEANALIHYRLACCECALGFIEVAKFRLKYALKLDPSLRSRALEEPDLEQVW